MKPLKALYDGFKPSSYDALLLEELLQWAAVRVFHSQSPFIRV